jgi:pantetheine-phosphate adenylyltransferase
MSNPVIAIYPGTFDPITLGHQDLIRRAADLFGTVVVGVAVAHHKKTLLSFDERLALVRELVQPYANVRAEGFSSLVVEFAVHHRATAMVRGVRSATDLAYESQLAGMNRAMAPGIDTVFLTPDARFQHLSSTMVREIARLQGDVSQFVAPQARTSLLAKFKAQLT